MLSLLLSRRKIRSHTFDTFDQLAAHVELYQTQLELAGLVVMVGPDVTQHHVRRLDEMFENIECPAALVVFEDAMEEIERPDWVGARVRPSLHAQIPPRMLDVMRVVDEILAAAEVRDSSFVPRAVKPRRI
ncbi:MAG: hypothetical protein AAGF11_53780 [Myxococcota bacterium]